MNKYDCPFCGAPQRIDGKAASLWINIMKRLGISDFWMTQAAINSLRKKRQKKPKEDK